VACIGLGAAWTPVSAAQDPQTATPGTVYAGATTPVSFSASNVLACTPPAYYAPGGPYWYNSPEGVQVGGATGQQLIDGATVSVTVPADLPSYVTYVFISWSGSTECASYNGYVYIDVLPPLTEAQAAVVKDTRKLAQRQIELGKRFKRADNAGEKKSLIKKQGKLAKRGKAELKEWRQEGLPTKKTDPGAKEPFPLFKAYRFLKDLALFGRDLLRGCYGPLQDPLDCPRQYETFASAVTGVGN
jgi:hypothetical protein